MIGYFNRFKQLASVAGKSNEYIVLTRSEKSNTQFNFNYVDKALTKKDSAFDQGDILTIASEKYFCVGRRGDEIKLFKSNCTINIVKIEATYTGGTKTGDRETSLFSAQPASQQLVTASMKIIEPGLLPETVRKFLIGNLAVNIGDRIKVGSENFWIISIDDISYPGLKMVQVKIDNRKVS